MKKLIAVFTSVITLFSLSVPMLAPVAAQAQTTSSSCYTFTRNLGEGRPLSAQEGSALARDLTNEGLWSAGNSITTYTDQLASAVSGFQEKYAAQVLTPSGLTYGTGYIGNATRTELNLLYGCSASTSTNMNSNNFQCPAGWTCSAPTTQPTQTFSCPSGWVCSAPATTSPAPTNPSCSTGDYSYCVTSNPTSPYSPTLSYVNPSQASAYQVVTLTGTNFSGATDIHVSNGYGIDYSFAPTSVSANGTSMTFSVPATLGQGSYTISVYNVTNSNQSSNTLSFNVGPVNTVTTCTYNCSTTSQSVPTHIPNSSDQQVTFTKNFSLNQISGPVTLAIEADNEYSVSVNGYLIDTNNNQANFFAPTTYDITHNVRSGNNTLSIIVTNQNSAQGFQWSVNPGGLAYTVTNSGSTITSSDGTEQASVNGRTDSAMVIPSNLVYSSMWRNLSGANWIWDTGLLNQYALNGSSYPTNPVTNQAPVVTGVSAPTTLNVSQQGTWSVSAYDPQNSQLSYSVNWGDTNSGCPAGYTCAVPAVANAFTQTSSFTHSYSAPGTYTATFTVRDSAGLTAQTSATVQVGGTVTTTGQGSASLSLDTSSPVSSTFAATNSVQGQYLNLPVFVFDVAARGDTLHLHNVVMNVSGTGNGAVTAAYLYQGSTPVASASVANGVATFANISDGTAGAIIPVNTTVPFTVKVDVTGLTSSASGAQETVVASIQSAGLTAYNSIDAAVPVSGSATGNAITVTNSGTSAAPAVTYSLGSTPTITKTNISPGGATTSSFQYTATFNVVAQATGGNVTFGLPNSQIPAFGALSVPGNIAQLFVNGSPITNDLVQLIASYSQPANTTLNSGGTSFTLGQNQTVSIPVTYRFVVNNPGANTYSVGLEGINSSVGLNTTMAGQSNWMTQSI